MTARPVPICLVVGFLGSGKTTLLSHIAKQHGDQRLAFLVNEFSTLDVDGAALRRLHDNVICLPGGSVFCKCLAGQFVQALRTLPETLGLADCGGVVVEASGIADPGVAPVMLRDAGLEDVYELRQVIAVVDPGNLADLLEGLPNAKSQLMAADVVILNKQDLYDEARMKDATTLVRTFNGQALLQRASYCRLELPLFETGRQRAAHGGYAPCADPNFYTTTVQLARAVDAERLTRALNAAPQFLYRAKGFLPVARGCVYLDWTPTSVSCFELPDHDGPIGFSLIGKGSQAAAVNALAAKIEAGVFGAVD